MAVLKEKTVVASVKMPIGESWSILRCRYRSEDGAQARVCLATGIHGDERMGQLVIYDVAQRIMAQPQHLHGIVDMYPMLNPIGLDVGQRMVPSSTIGAMISLILATNSASPFFMAMPSCSISASPAL